MATSKVRDDRWSLAVKKRDNFRCRWCDDDGTDACHIENRGILHLRYVLQNGITFCRTHHKKFDRKSAFRDEMIKRLVGEDLNNKLREAKNDRFKIKEFGFEEIL